MTAFQAGFEVECKIAEWMLPDAYRRALHASAAEGTIGAAVAVLFSPSTTSAPRAQQTARKSG